MKRFEYRVERLYFRNDAEKWTHRGSIQNFLNNLGYEGWELVKIDGSVYFFKRAIELSKEEQKELEEKARFEKLQAKVQYDKSVKECEALYEETIQKYPQLKESSAFNTFYESFKKGDVSPEKFKEKAEVFVQVL